MFRKIMYGWVILAMLFVAMLPRESRGADWKLSPYRAQVAEQTSANTAPTDTLATGGAPRKQVGKAVLFSLIIPGTGQVYAGPAWTALPWLAIEVGAWVLASSSHSKGQKKTDEFQKYADENFLQDAYWFREWQVAKRSHPDSTTARYATLDQWKAETWENRQTHLPAPFTHPIDTKDKQQYYEMIGKYVEQFGWGWIESFADATWNGNGNLETFYWKEPNTIDRVGFQGPLPSFYHYADMRGEANDFLNKGNTAMEVVMVNHLLSAVHAAYLTTKYNKKISKTRTLGDINLRYDNRLVEGRGSYRCLTLSIPLD